MVKAADDAGLRVEGVLEVEGTTAEPAVLTSLRDDIFAGDSNGDGNDTSAAPGDWGGISAFGMQAQVLLDGAQVRYAATELNGVAAVDVRNSRFEHAYGDALSILGNGWPDPGANLMEVRVSDNVFTGTRAADETFGISGRALVIQDNHPSPSEGIEPGIDLRVSRLQNNIGSDNDRNYAQIDYWVAREDTTWGFGDGALPVLLGGRPRVPAGRSLDVPAGSVLKFTPSCCTRPSLEIEGTLAVDGNGAEPVTFTTAGDDSVGGDTNANGASSSPEAGDWDGIHVEGAQSQLQLDGAVVRYGATAALGAASVDVQGSRFENAPGFGLGIFTSAEWPGPEGELQQVRVYGNAFATTGSNGEDTGVLKIFDWRPGSTPKSRGMELRVDRLQDNTGVGNGKNYMEIYGWTAREDTEWDFGPDALPVVLDGEAHVPAGLTLTLPAGTSTKFAPGPFVESRLSVEGTLWTDGTEAEPVTLTSLADDAILGDTNGDETPPATGDWRGLAVEDGAEVSLRGTEIRFAQTAISQSGGIVTGEDVRLGVAGAPVDVAIGQEGGQAALRGSVAIQTYGVYSCPWESLLDCGVDAAEVDWGRPEGPEGIVCGRVLTSPYAHEGELHASSLWGGGSCVGDEGPEAGLLASQVAYAESLAELEIECTAGEEAICDLIGQYLDCFQAQAEIAGLHAPFPYEVPNSSDAFDTFGTVALGNAGTYVSQSHNPFLRSAGRLTSVASLADTAQTLYELKGAYEICGS